MTFQMKTLNDFNIENMFLFRFTKKLIDLRPNALRASFVKLIHLEIQLRTDQLKD